MTFSTFFFVSFAQNHKKMNGRPNGVTKNCSLLIHYFRTRVKCLALFSYDMRDTCVQHRGMPKNKVFIKPRIYPWLEECVLVDWRARHKFGKVGH